MDLNSCAVLPVAFFGYAAKRCGPKFGRVGANVIPLGPRLYENVGAIWGAHTKRKFTYGKERSPRGLECECTQKERSTSITKQLVFEYPFA
jgi:hypothetical protein